MTDPVHPAGVWLDRVLYQWTEHDFALTATSVPQPASDPLLVGLLPYVRNSDVGRPQESLCYLLPRDDQAALLSRRRGSDPTGRGDSCLGLIGPARALSTRLALSLFDWPGWGGTVWSGYGLESVDSADITAWCQGAGQRGFPANWRPGRVALEALVAARLAATDSPSGGRAMPVPVVAPELDLPSTVAMLWCLLNVADHTKTHGATAQWAQRVAFRTFSTFETRSDSASDPPDVLFLLAEPEGRATVARLGEPVRLGDGPAGPFAGVAVDLVESYRDSIRRPPAAPPGVPGPSRQRGGLGSSGPGGGPGSSGPGGGLGSSGPGGGHGPNGPGGPVRSGVTPGERRRSPHPRDLSDYELAHRLGQAPANPQEVWDALVEVRDRQTAQPDSRAAVLSEMIESEFGAEARRRLRPQRRAEALSQLVWFAIADEDLEQPERLAELARWVADPRHPDDAVTEVLRRAAVVATVEPLIQAAGERHHRLRGIDPVAQPVYGVLADPRRANWRTASWTWYRIQPWPAKTSIALLLALLLLLIAIQLADLVGVGGGGGRRTNSAGVSQGQSARTAAVPARTVQPQTVSPSAASATTAPAAGTATPPDGGSVEVSLRTDTGLLAHSKNDGVLVGYLPNPLPTAYAATVTSVMAHLGPGSQTDIRLSYLDSSGQWTGPVDVRSGEVIQQPFAGTDASGVWIVVSPRSSDVTTLTVTWKRSG